MRSADGLATGGAVGGGAVSCAGRTVSRPIMVGLVTSGRPHGGAARFSHSSPGEVFVLSRRAGGRILCCGAADGEKMTFECDGQRYDSAGLLMFQTGDMFRPIIYLIPDLTSVFVVEAHWEGITVRRVTDPAEIRALAARFALADLRRGRTSVAPGGTAT